MISILYKFISQDVRKIISESYDDVLLVFDTVEISFECKNANPCVNDVRGVTMRSRSRFQLLFSHLDVSRNIAHSCHKVQKSNA